MGEYIEFEMKKTNKKIKEKNKKELKQIDENKETEEDDAKTSTGKDWMDAQQFQLCDLLYRKAIKLSPNCIKTHLNLTKFLFQTNKMSAAHQIYEKTLKLIENAI